MTHFLYCYAITGYRKDPSKKPIKGASKESEEEQDSKPFLSESLDFL